MRPCKFGNIQYINLWHTHIVQKSVRNCAKEAKEYRDFLFSDDEGSDIFDEDVADVSDEEYDASVEGILQFDKKKWSDTLLLYTHRGSVFGSAVTIHLSSNNSIKPS